MLNFVDNRLYIQNGTTNSQLNSSASKSPRDASKHEPSTDSEWCWQLACSAKQNWLDFPQRFARSRNGKEKTFFKFLTNQLVPRIIEDFDEHEKQEERETKRLRGLRIFFARLFSN